MATRTFNLNTEPHEAIVGDVTLRFEPEAIGSDFLAAYTELQDAQARVQRLTAKGSSSTKHARPDKLSAEDIASVTTAMRNFVSRFLLPESVPVFEGMRLPDRILLQLVEYAAELYGGGSGNQDAAGGTSTD